MKPIETLRGWFGLGAAKKDAPPVSGEVATKQPDDQLLTEVTLPNKRVALVDVRGNFRGYK